MALAAGLIGASAAVGVGSALLGASSSKKAAKEQQKAAEKQAALAKAGTIESTRFQYQSALARTNLEESATAEQARIEGRQQIESAEQQAQAAEANARRDAAAVEAAIYANRSMSAIEQDKAARAARQNASEAATRAFAGGVGLSGSSGAVIKQGLVLDELDRLDGAYKHELDVRGMMFDEASIYAKAVQVRQSVDLAKRQAGEDTEFTIRQSGAYAALNRSQATKSRDISLKYADLGYEVAKQDSTALYKNMISTIGTQTAINIGASLLGAATTGYQYGQQGAFQGTALEKLF